MSSVTNSEELESLIQKHIKDETFLKKFVTESGIISTSIFIYFSFLIIELCVSHLRTKTIGDLQIERANIEPYTGSFTKKLAEIDDKINSVQVYDHINHFEHYLSKSEIQNIISKNTPKEYIVMLKILQKRYLDLDQLDTLKQIDKELLSYLSDYCKRKALFEAKKKIRYHAHETYKGIGDAIIGDDAFDEEEKLKLYKKYKNRIFEVEPALILILGGEDKPDRNWMENYDEYANTCLDASFNDLYMRKLNTNEYKALKMFRTKIKIYSNKNERRV